MREKIYITLVSLKRPEFPLDSYFFGSPACHSACLSVSALTISQRLGGSLVKKRSIPKPWNSPNNHTKCPGDPWRLKSLHSTARRRRFGDAAAQAGLGYRRGALA